MILPKKSNLLILRGCSLTNYENTRSLAGLLYRQTYTDDAACAYVALPARFTDAGEWPASSNLHCWFCDLTLPDYPRFIPLNVETTLVSAANSTHTHETCVRDTCVHETCVHETCDVFGCFCSWNCAAAYAMRELPEYMRWDTLRYICVFESKFTGRLRAKVHPAPPRTLMKKYSGESGLTPQQYRARLAALNELT